MADNLNVLFMRGQNQNDSASDHDDVWDDSLLIKAYDKAVNLAKEEVAKRLSMATDSSQAKGVKFPSAKQPLSDKIISRKWTVGSPCRAVYSEDGKIYEAVISKMFNNSEECLVKFIGYGNTERVEISSLLESDGLPSQELQQRDAEILKSSLTNANNSQTSQENHAQGETMDFETEIPRQQRHPMNSGFPHNPMGFGMMPPAPPIPPQLMARLPDNDSDALSSMLMSWYISGFHTGYYHGIKQAQKNECRSKKS